MRDETAHDERLRTLEHLVGVVQARSAERAAFKRAVGGLVADLEYISAGLHDDPDIWRLNRAFHVVHAPSLIAVMAMFEAGFTATQMSDAEEHEIYASLQRAASLATRARLRIEQAKLSDAKVTLEVLADAAPKPTVPYEPASLARRAMDGVVSASGSTWKGAMSGAAAVPNVAGRLKSAARTSITRVGAVPLLAMNLQKTLSGMVADGVTRPIDMRLQAGSKALQHGAGAGVGLGVVIGVLCPPLLPVSAGGAALAAMRAWRKEMDAAQDLNAAERAARIAELNDARAAALRQLAHGDAAFQMETDEISLTVDADTGDVDAVILTGEHTGRTWSSLSRMEKLTVVELLAGSADALVSILEFGREIL